MKRAFVWPLFLGVAACGEPTTSEPPVVDLPEGACGHGVYVVASDYGSTNVDIVTFAGTIAGDSIVSSASKATGLSATLSGDVIAPTMPTQQGSIVVIDREAAVITWVDPTAQRATKQLNIGNKTNPYDYLELATTKAYVPRYDIATGTDAASLDHGGDVLVIDPSAPSRTRSIDIATIVAKNVPGFTPHPGRVVLSGANAYVLATTYADGFQKSGDSALVRIDTATDAVTGALVLTGLKGCLGLDVSPNREALAVGCSGTFGGGSTPTLDDAGVAIVDVASFAITTAIKGVDLGEPASFAIAFASEDHVLVPVFGSIDQHTTDGLLSIDLSTKPTPKVTSIVKDEPAFTLGEVRCAPACGACFLARKSDATLRRFTIEDSGAVTGSSDIPLNDGVNLPPLYFGIY